MVRTCTEQMTEMAAQMQGPPGPPGRGRPGRPGSPGPQGRPGTTPRERVTNLICLHLIP